jgi:hypothetical protein
MQARLIASTKVKLAVFPFIVCGMIRTAGLFVFVWSLLVTYTVCTFYRVAAHCSHRGSFIASEACLRRELKICFSPAVNLPYVFKEPRKPLNPWQVPFLCVIKLSC